MAPYSLLHPLSSVCFEDKIKFSASQQLSLARSKWFTLTETASQSDVWSINPPDFSLQPYRSLAVPQRKETKTHSNEAEPQETKRRTGIFLPPILNNSHKRESCRNFITSYRPPDALESELMFVKTGKYRAESYKNPEPHDFRPVRLCKHKTCFMPSSACLSCVSNPDILETGRQDRNHFSLWFVRSDLSTRWQYMKINRHLTNCFLSLTSAWWGPSRLCYYIWERSW